MSRGVSHTLGRRDVRDVPLYIYALTDPDGAIRYVGKSCKPRKRVCQHAQYNAAGPVRRWIADLRTRGTRPGLRILRVVPPGEDAAAWELHYVRFYRPQGILNFPYAAERQETGT